MVYFDLSDFDKGWKRETGFRGTRDLQNEEKAQKIILIFHSLCLILFTYIYTMVSNRIWIFAAQGIRIR